MSKKITNSFEETQNFGEEIAGKIDNINVISLKGDLGSGKTTFVQGLAKGLGIKRKIISPTFIILRTYEIENPKIKKKTFYHVDLYRIKDEGDVEGLGLPELMNDPENILAIEWPEKIEKILPSERMEIAFEYLDHERRKIEINNE